MALKSVQCYHHQSETERSTGGNDAKSSINMDNVGPGNIFPALGLLTMSRRLTGPHIYPRHTRKM